MNQKIYLLDELKDENKLKQETRCGKKNRVYEDLRFRISFECKKREVTKKHLSLEVDNDTIDTDKVVHSEIQRLTHQK